MTDRSNSASADEGAPNDKNVKPRTRGQTVGQFIERAGKLIPDPVIIFMAFYPLAFVLTVIFGGYGFSTIGAGGEAVQHQLKNMADPVNLRWVFDNALLANWLGFGGSVIGVILVVMLAIGLAENSGLFGALIKRVGGRLPQGLLPLLLIFLGIISSVATDAGYLVLIPLAGLLYAGIGRNPLIGMAAAFAGVSAGFSANLIPGPVDVIIGLNAQVFAESQGVPFTSAAGEALNPATMHWTFIIVSTFVLAITGFWVTRRIVAPRLERMEWQTPSDIQPRDFQVSEAERRGLRGALGGLVLAFYLGRRYGGDLAENSQAWFDWDPAGWRVICYVAVFIGTYAAVWLLGYWFRGLLNKARLASADRSLGFVLGVLKGAVFVAIAFQILVIFYDWLPQDVQIQLVGDSEGTVPASHTLFRLTRTRYILGRLRSIRLHLNRS